MDLEPISGMNGEVSAEFELLNGEYGLADAEDTEQESPDSPSHDTPEDSREIISLDESVEDEKEKNTIDMMFGSACCSLVLRKVPV